MTSREGNSIPPKDSRVRIAVQTNTLCKKCIHILDLCELIKKEEIKVGSYCVITRCDGFEKLNS